MAIFFRPIAALITLTATLYMATCPFSFLSIQPTHVVHKVTGICSGNCKTDGCSVANRENHTCCCWASKIKAMPQEEKSCCLTRITNTAVTTLNDQSASEKDGLFFRCGEPCGHGDCCALLIGMDNDQLLMRPNRDKCPQIVPPTITLITPTRLASCQNEPPDPPPPKTLV